MTEKRLSEKKYATINHPSVKAALKSFYRFETEQQALNCIKELKAYFVASKHFAAQQLLNTVTLWVRGYEVTKEELAQGYTGNYVTISVKAKGDKFTLHGKKLEAELQLHPQRKRPKHDHPDWGHAILRAIKKKHIYTTIEKADAELRRLHEAFPTISIPDEHRLMIILYEKQQGETSPVQKYKFEIKALSEGGYFIDYKSNNKPKAPTSKQPAEAQGHFAAMVTLRRKKRRRPAS